MPACVLEPIGADSEEADCMWLNDAVRMPPLLCSR
jgi:hypothetical protein